MSVDVFDMLNRSKMNNCYFCLYQLLIKQVLLSPLELIQLIRDLKESNNRMLFLTELCNYCLYTYSYVVDNTESISTLKSKSKSLKPSTPTIATVTTLNNTNTILIPVACYNVLIDILRVLLREANNSCEFHCISSIYNLSRRLACVVTLPLSPSELKNPSSKTSASSCNIICNVLHSIVEHEAFHNKLLWLDALDCIYNKDVKYIAQMRLTGTLPLIEGFFQLDMSSLYMVLLLCRIQCIAKVYQSITMTSINLEVDCVLAEYIQGVSMLFHLPTEYNVLTNIECLSSCDSASPGNAPSRSHVGKQATLKPEMLSLKRLLSTYHVELGYIYWLLDCCLKFQHCNLLTTLGDVSTSTSTHVNANIYSNSTSVSSAIDSDNVFSIHFSPICNIILVLCKCIQKLQFCPSISQLLVSYCSEETDDKAEDSVLEVEEETEASGQPSVADIETGSKSSDDKLKSKDKPKSMGLGLLRKFTEIRKSITKATNPSAMCDTPVSPSASTPSVHRENSNSSNQRLSTNNICISCKRTMDQPLSESEFHLHTIETSNKSKFNNESAVKTTQSAHRRLFSGSNGGYGQHSPYKHSHSQPNDEAGQNDYAVSIPCNSWTNSSINGSIPFDSCNPLEAAYRYRSMKYPSIICEYCMRCLLSSSESVCEGDNNGVQPQTSVSADAVDKDSDSNMASNAIYCIGEIVLPTITEESVYYTAKSPRTNKRVNRSDSDSALDDNGLGNSQNSVEILRTSMSDSFDITDTIVDVAVITPDSESDSESQYSDSGMSHTDQIEGEVGIASNNKLRLQTDMNAISADNVSEPDTLSLSLSGSDTTGIVRAMSPNSDHYIMHQTTSQGVSDAIESKSESGDMSRHTSDPDLLEDQLEPEFDVEDEDEQTHIYNYQCTTVRHSFLTYFTNNRNQHHKLINFSAHFQCMKHILNNYRVSLE